MRAFTELWDRVCAERYGVTDPKLRRMRYGVQVNSLGLTEAQPENNIQRIVLESLGVTLSKRARARALQLPAWNEALGLPRPVGPAVVAAHPADPGLRVRPARVRRHLRRLRGHRGARRPRWPRRRGPSSRTSWRWAGAFEAIDELKSPPGGQPVRAGPPHRDGRAPGGRGQLLHRDGRRPRWPPAGARAAAILRVDPAVESQLRDDVEALAGRPRRRRRPAGPRRAPAGRRGHRQRDARHHRPGPRRGHHRRVGRRPARGVRRVPGPDRGRAAASATGAPSSRPCWPAPGRWPTGPVGRPGCWWPSPASTATPTGPNRSPWPPATPASRSSTRASGSPPPRSRPPPATRMSTWSGSRSSRAATWSSSPRWSTGCGRRGSTRRWWSGGIIPPRTRRCCWARAWPAVYTPKDFEIGQMMDDMIDLVEQHRATRRRLRPGRTGRRPRGVDGVGRVTP